MNSHKKNNRLVPQREKIKSRLNEIDDTYQLIIIGGGIYGAALCWEAAHRGIKTLLIEKEDYASGASSNSLKTIHGGLRALQSFNIPAVIKGIRERSIYLKIAKNYVKPLPCLMPTTHKLKRSKLVIGCGLFAYNVLNILANALTIKSEALPRARLQSLKEFTTKTGLLINNKLTGGGLWYDAQVINTERMVLQFITAAQKYNAVTLNHTLASKYIANKDGNLHRIVINDQISGDCRQVNAPIVIDCSSAWSFITRDTTTRKIHDDITFLKSVNIVINKKLSETAFGIDINEKATNENRLYFFAPWRDCTLIGTWYRLENKHPDHSFTKQEVLNYIDDINIALGSKKISLDDICNIHIGSLPARPASSSDQTNIDKLLLGSYQFKDWSGELDTTEHLYSLRGTKYTLARYDSKKVVDHLASLKKWDIAKSKSAEIPIYNEYNEATASHEIPREIFNKLVINYGAELERIIQLTKDMPWLVEVIPGTDNHIKAEIYHCVLSEQALTLADLLKRRLDIGDRALPRSETANYCANIMQQLLSWPDEKVELEIEELYASYPQFLTDNHNGYQEATSVKSDTESL